LLQQPIWDPSLFNVIIKPNYQKINQTVAIVGVVATSAAPLIHDLHWLRINECIQYKLGSIAFNAIKLKQPSYLSELLHIHVPTHSLRSESHLMPNVPLCKLKTSQSSFCFSAPIVWNGLSKKVRTSATRDIFRLKTELFIHGS